MKIMTFRKPLLVALIAASLGAVAVPTLASADTEIFFDRAPPQLRHEVVPAPRRGYLWVPGYWDARNQKHHWRVGHWERERVGYKFVEPRWVERNNGWALERGRWNPADRDGDGVPNYRDRQPDNPRVQ
jgi:WXXGXW repeat (2 copies)